MSHHSACPLTISDRVLMTEHEVKEAIKQRADLKAELRALLKPEQAAYKQAAADPEEGELLDSKYTYIRGASQVLESHLESTDSSKSKISVYRDPMGRSSSKRKANDEGDVPGAKKQQKASFDKTLDVGRRGEQEDTLALINEGPAVLGRDPPEQTTPDVGRLQPPQERNIRKPMSRFGKDVKQPNVSHEWLVLEDKQPSDGMAKIPREEANKASKKKPVNISKGSGTDVETRTPARSSVPSMGPPLGAESAFDQMSKRNKEALKNQVIQDAVIRKLRVDKIKEIRTNKDGGRASRPAAPKLRSPALLKKRKSGKPLARPKDEDERTPDWQRSFSTGPPKTTTSKPTVAQIQNGANETMVSGKVGSIDRKRKAEEGLEDSGAKIAKENMGPFSKRRHTSLKRAIAPTQNLTDREVIFGKGSKSRKPDVQRIRVPRSNRPSQHKEDMQHSDE